MLPCCPVMHSDASARWCRANSSVKYDQPWRPQQALHTHSRHTHSGGHSSSERYSSRQLPCLSPSPRMRDPSVTTMASTFLCGQFHTIEACTAAAAEQAEQCRLRSAERQQRAGSYHGGLHSGGLPVALDSRA